MTFKDHFSKQAADYAKFRPHYPPKLFDYLASLAPGHDYAWDCATGNGQAAIGLATHFQRVIATDASAQQIENAERHDSVFYSVAPAENSGIKSDSIDLIMVAQALHWFDLDAFFNEARRVLKRGGILAVSSYNFLEVAPEIDRIVKKFYRQTTGPFWPPERELVENDYASIEFPFPELPPVQFEMIAHWNLHQLLGYLRTWSATQKFIAAKKFDPVEPLAKELAAHWKNVDETRAVKWPLHLRVGVHQKNSITSRSTSEKERGGPCDPPLPCL